MPAEAIHLTALWDTLVCAPGHVRRWVGAPGGARWRAARAGAVLVDLPYFDRFAWALVRYVLERPQAPSRWGDVLHQRAPIRVGVALGEAGVRLSRRSESAEAGAYLIGLCVGYLSHAALDTALHPLVNRLARRRARALRDVESRQHNEVEKYQSILYHQERNGFDFMGTRVLREHAGVDHGPVVEPGLVRDVVLGVMDEVLGDSPGLEELSGWARGYGQYVAVISGPLGTRIAPAADRERARAEVYERVDFAGRFGAAVVRSRRWVEVMSAYLADGVFDEGAKARLAAEIPEQTLDPGPEPEELDGGGPAR